MHDGRGRERTFLLRFDYLLGGSPEIDRRTYEDAAVVAAYGRDGGLQPAERLILKRFQPVIAQMDMLDIGVGAGRTARHFAPLVRSYLGIDYSHAMIEHCRADQPAVRFEVCDARALDFVADESFDLVLFSYNGIDHLHAADRARVLLGMKRVLRPKGFLVFSSHNTNFIVPTMEMFRFKPSSTLRGTLRSLKWAMVFNLRNPTLRLRLPLAEGRVVDGAHGFQSSGNHYVRPDLQVAALRRLGLEPLECIGNDRDEGVDAADDRVAVMPDPWVYYVSRKPAGEVS
jgi:SAM-dependent methyltransferase